MKKIKLTQGKFAVVDDDDFEYLNQWKWFYSSGYARRNDTESRGKFIFLHRLINNTPKNSLTDHINQDTLDNRKSNLRTGDKRLNSLNTGLQKNNKSGYKGISWENYSNKWYVYIMDYQKRIYLGRFSNLKDAIKIRKEAELKYHAI